MVGLYFDFIHIILKKEKKKFRESQRERITENQYKSGESVVMYSTSKHSNIIKIRFSQS